MANEPFSWLLHWDHAFLGSLDRLVDDLRSFGLLATFATNGIIGFL